MEHEFRKIIKPHRNKVVQHPVYSRLKTPDDIRVFMKFHVYAVWDFMSLLKELQRRFTNVERIWYPKKNARLARLVNEIVVAEESDIMESGEVISHYDWYIRAMKQCGSWTEEFNSFYEYSKISPKLDVTMLVHHPAIEQFLKRTFEVIDLGKDHELAAYFLVGREALIPEMFVSIVESLNDQADRFSLFLSYLKRHIEVDSEEHGPLADKMLAELCGDDDLKWREAADSASKALLARSELWDGVLDAKVRGEEIH